MAHMTMIGLTLGVILLQGALLAAVLMCVRSFGAYTEIVLQTHNQNMLIQQENFNLTDDLARLRAQLLEERRSRCSKPTHSEDAVA